MTKITDDDLEKIETALASEFGSSVEVEVDDTGHVKIDAAGGAKIGKYWQFADTVNRVICDATGKDLHLEHLEIDC